MSGYAVGVGAANTDVHGRSKNPIVMRDSNPGHLHTSAGGVTRNVLENLARQGVETHMLTACGDDVYGELIRRESEAAGIDMSRVLTVPGRCSSCYIAVLDERGDMLLGMSDMSILECITEEYLARNGELLRGAEVIVCDPCLPIPIVSHICQVYGRHTPVYLDPVSTAYARAVAPVAGGIYCLKPNLMELGVLAGADTPDDASAQAAAEILLARGVRQVAVSMGERGCLYADAEGRRIRRALRPVTVMENATGAGDAFMSGLIYGRLRGLEAEETLDYALACGIVALQSEQTISPRMSGETVRRTVSEYKL